MIRSIMPERTHRSSTLRGYIFSDLLILGIALVPGATKLYSLGPEPGVPFSIRSFHFIQQVDDSTYINWTGGFIYTSIQVPLKQVNSTDAPSAMTPGSLTEARAMARQEAQRLAMGRLFHALKSFPVESNKTVADLLRENERFRMELGNLQDRVRVKSRRTGEGYVALELGLYLYGRNGLLGILPDRSGEEIPSVSPFGPEDEITGIIVVIDPELPFKPVLRPSVYMSNGRRIYGPGTLLPGLSRPPVLYFKSIEDARNRGNAGLRPAIVYATEIMNTGDAVIDSSDARRILGSRTGRQALRQSKVIFVMP
ncbi:MAG: hypothetical protein KDK33_05320 [Leptospiraceae bacterium]|nr:hypothetical protein [Leptospiraceae bacterium]